MKIDQPLDVAAHNSNGDRLRNRMMDRFGPKFETQLRPDAKAAFVRAQAAPSPTPASSTAMPKPPQSPAQKLEPVWLGAPVKPQREKGEWSLEAWRVVTLIIAIGLAVVAGCFSVTGMGQIFPGAMLLVIPMAILMELGKLVGAGWLSRNWRDMIWPLRLVLAFLITVLAVINAVSVYGQLSYAHLNPHVVAIAATGEDAAVSSGQIDAQQHIITDLDKQIAQIDAAIDETTKRGRSSAAMELAQKQAANRLALVKERNAAAAALVELRKAQARVAGAQQKAAADVGVLQYAADLAGVDREQMIQLLILAMVLSCDPLSITLVLATAHRRRVA